VGRGPSNGFRSLRSLHAAIYVGSDHEICESTPGEGVILSHLESKLDDNCLLVRRVPNLGDDDRDGIAIEAGALRRNPYGWSQIFAVVLKRYARTHPVAGKESQRGVICSSLCEHAILAATRG
jgi:hypothetical protein